MGTFFISPETGQLKLLQSLDREKKDLYRLTLVATDNGAHRLSSEAEVMVTYIASYPYKHVIIMIFSENLNLTGLDFQVNAGFQRQNMLFS